MKKTSLITIILLMISFITSFISTQFYEVMQITYKGDFDILKGVMVVLSNVSFYTLALAALFFLIFIVLCIIDLFKKDNK